jgi:putative SOS response-associated peptidase YedK
MCGRAKLPDDVSEIKIDLKIDVDEIGQYQSRWNAAPTTKLPVVVVDKAQRILTLMRWGLVPSSTFNARAETLASRAAFRGAWQAGRRCLVICRRLLRVARCRQTAVCYSARQSWADDACRLVGIVALATGRNDQIFRHHHHKCQ